VSKNSIFFQNKYLIQSNLADKLSCKSSITNSDYIHTIWCY